MKLSRLCNRWLIFVSIGFAGPNAIGNGDLGLLFSGTVRAKVPWRNTTTKAVVLTLDRTNGAYICYDTELLRVSSAWTGAYLNFGNYQNEVHHPQPPEAAGIPVMATKLGPGWSREGSFVDARQKSQGPLPRDWAKYRGLYLSGDRAVMCYSVGDVRVLEMPSFSQVGGGVVFGRALQLDKPSSEAILVSEWPESAEVQLKNPLLLHLELPDAKGPARSCFAVAVRGAPTAQLELQGDKVVVKLGGTQTNAFEILNWAGPQSEFSKFESFAMEPSSLENLEKLCAGGAARWTNVIVTEGTLGTGSGEYLLDILRPPVPNPWNSKTFFSAFDFFPDGQAAISTFHGDVWIVSGIDETLQKVTWRRFATGLAQPLGLKVVKGLIYVIGRDQITRLHDLDKNGEADFFENFNNDVIATENYHEFCLDLQTDAEGNFYFGKAAPVPLNVKSPHQGCLLKVSQDGLKMEILATGFRAPNGIAIGPNGEITASDNQGHWVPASKLNWITKDGFYGVIPAAQRASKPSEFNRPMCWLPTSVDSSSSGQVWVTSDKWGPFKNHLLLLSYGKCTLFHVMHEKVNGQVQAAMTAFPLKFNSGVTRARFNPVDGQLYVSGLRGWQTSGLDDGGFYRVRYSGRPVHMPLEFHASHNGVSITFTTPLDKSSATNPENYDIEQWNYKWSEEYGSPEYSVANPNARIHDRVAVKAIQLSADQKTVALAIPGIRPVDQIRIRFKLTAADATLIQQQLFCTIHALGPEVNLTSAK